MAFKYPSTTVTRINLRPLVPPGGLEKLSPERILKKLQREVTRELKSHLFQTALTHRARRALQEGFEVKVHKNSITVRATHPAFRPLLEGQRSKQMTWLTKATRPIPIITDEGKLIFRNATPRSMQNGSWYHPGRQPTTVIERARSAARELVREKVGKDLRKQLRAAVARARR